MSTGIAAPVQTDDRAPARGGQRLRVLEGLHLGIPSYWYPVLNSADLEGGNHLQGVKRFGLELVLWRDAAGKPHAFEDRCPHRAARLSVGSREPGKVRGETLACWYHGWRFDASGRCVEIPTENVCDLAEERTSIRAFPVQERAGYIWLYYGSGEPPALQVPEEMEDPTWLGFRTTVSWRTSWLNVMDNLADPMHQYVLHGTGYTTKRRPPFNRVRIAEETDESVRIVQYLEDDQGRVAIEEQLGFQMLLPNMLRGELLNAVPGGNVRVIMFMTPIDAENAYVCYWRGRQVEGKDRVRWWIQWHRFYRSAVMKIADQDEAMLSTMGPLSATRGREHLAASDIGVIRFRRLLNRAFDRATRGQGSGPSGGPASGPAAVNGVSG